MIGISARQAAKLFDPPCSERVIREAQRRGEITSRTVGVRAYFDVEALREWFASRPATKRNAA
jgi:hypothetical protein